MDFHCDEKGLGGSTTSERAQESQPFARALVGRTFGWMQVSRVVAQCVTLFCKLARPTPAGLCGQGRLTPAELGNSPSLSRL